MRCQPLSSPSINWLGHSCLLQAAPPNFPSILLEASPRFQQVERGIRGAAWSVIQPPCVTQPWPRINPRIGCQPSQKVTYTNLFTLLALEGTQHRGNTYIVAVLPAKRSCISVFPILRFIQFRHTAQPCLAWNGTRCFSFSDSISLRALLSTPAYDWPVQGEAMHSWSLCHAALFSYQHVHCTVSHLNGSLCWFSLKSKLCYTKSNSGTHGVPILLKGFKIRALHRPLKFLHNKPVKIFLVLRNLTQYFGSCSGAL